MQHFQTAAAQAAPAIGLAQRQKFQEDQDRRRPCNSLACQSSCKLVYRNIRAVHVLPGVPCCRLGADWNEKKSICNKFVQQSQVTSVCWPAQRQNEVVFGLADGKVKLGMLKTNKTYSMYAHPDGSYVISLAASSSGNAVVSGHVDGAVFKFAFPEQEGQAPTYSKLLQHSCAPTALAWGDSICVAGSDCRVSRVHH